MPEYRVAFIPAIAPFKENGRILTNSFTREEAFQKLSSSPKFCNFIYSHSEEPRDTFFHLLSQYKHIDSSGKHLNNTGTQSTRYNSDWYTLSIKMKEGYKFSIAMENSSSKGYTTEKIISSLQAHTVPIYWGDPAVSEFINPKAFINCGDYSSFDEVVERVKEVDSNDDLWLDMVTQPWQTEEQREKTHHAIEEYKSMVYNIFTQDIRKARRRTQGVWGDNCRKGFTGINGMLPPLHIRAVRKIRRNKTSSQENSPHELDAKALPAISQEGLHCLYYSLGYPGEILYQRLGIHPVKERARCENPERH